MKKPTKNRIMKIIKIDKSTIRKNPNAGNTVTYMDGLKECSFEINGDIPEFINHPPFFIQEWVEENNKLISVSGLVNGPMEQRFLDEAPNLKINIHQEPIKVEHHPEPDYFFDYEETYLKCNNCKNKVEVDDIEADWVSDEYEIKICPKCGSENSFPEYRFQKLSEPE